MHSDLDSNQLDALPDEIEQPGLGMDGASPRHKQSRIISKVLSPAVRLFLKTQLDRVEDLHFSIEAGDRQLLSGSINQITVFARKAVYKGLCLSQVQIMGQEIRTNLGQVVRRRQALRLTNEFPISGEVVWHQADLNASLQAPLLAGGITEFLLALFKAGLEDRHGLGRRSPQEVCLQIPRIVLEPERLTLAATLVAPQNSPTSVVIRTGFHLENGNQLRLVQPEQLSHLGAQSGSPLHHLDGFTFDLGSSVLIQELVLEAGQLRCRGRVMVIPEG